jgi:hypothetical protein
MRLDLDDASGEMCGEGSIGPSSGKGGINA